MAAAKRDPLTAHYGDAGFAPGSDERIAAQARRGAQRNRREMEQGRRNPVSKLVVRRDGELEPVLPQAFINESLKRIEIHLARGHFSQVKETVAAIERDWNFRQLMQGQVGQATAEVLAIHVSQLVDVRTANVIEQECNGTVGALLECFPRSFIGKPQCGPASIEKMARALVRVGAIDAEEGRKRLAEYQDSLTMGDVNAQCRNRARNMSIE